MEGLGSHQLGAALRGDVPTTIPLLPVAVVYTGGESGCAPTPATLGGREVPGVLAGLELLTFPGTERPPRGRRSDARIAVNEPCKELNIIEHFTLSFYQGVLYCPP